MQCPDFAGDGERPPAFFGQADAMFAGDGAFPGDDFLEQFVQRRFPAADGRGIRFIEHDIHVDIPVTGMAEAGDRQVDLLLQPAGELEQVAAKENTSWLGKFWQKNG